MNAYVHRLYLYRRDEGRGIVGVVDSYLQEFMNPSQYVEGSEYLLVKILNSAK